MMRIKYLERIAAVLICSCMAVNAVHAELLVSENFDYELDSLDGADGGTGFGGEWIVNSVLPFDVDDPGQPLSYNMPGVGLISGGNRALHLFNDTDELLANEGNALQRAFESSIEEEDVYFSFLYRYDSDGFVDDNDFVIWWFNSGAGPSVGLKGNGGDGGPIPDDIMARVDSRFVEPHQVYAPDIDIIEEDEETFFVVVKISQGEESDEEGDYDEVSLWVNPSSGDETDPLSVGVKFPEDVGLFSLDSFGMRVFNQEPDDGMWWDALRIGTTWDDVVSPIGGANVPGDFDQSGDLGIADVDLLTEQILANDPDLAFDLDNDAAVTTTDLDTWIKDLRKTWIGDANLDGEFNSSDFVVVFEAGLFETGLAATWATGDWNGDGVFGSGDFVRAFQDGGFEVGQRAEANAVPEPSGASILIPLVICIFFKQRFHFSRVST